MEEDFLQRGLGSGLKSHAQGSAHLCTRQISPSKVLSRPHKLSLSAVTERTYSVSWEPFFEASLGHTKAHFGYLWRFSNLSKLLLVGEEVHGERMILRGLLSLREWLREQCLGLRPSER